jgi:hypothetical protein
MTATFKPYNAMTPDDYADIGFRCGLEIHQQLLTKTKPFCRCPAGRYSDAFDAEILRHMRPTLSELGEYDGTALMEKKTRKNIHSCAAPAILDPVIRSLRGAGKQRSVGAARTAKARLPEATTCQAARFSSIIGRCRRPRW